MVGLVAPLDDDESHIARYLLRHPDFLRRHPQVFEALQWPDDDAPPAGTASVASLPERQSRRLRERLRDHEAQLAQWRHLGAVNDVIIARMVHWACTMLREADPYRRAADLSVQLKAVFDLPAVAWRLLAAPSRLNGQAWARAVSSVESRSPV